MTRQAWIGALAATLVAALFIFYSREMAEFVVGLFFKKPALTQPQPPVATLDASAGSVFVSHEGHPDFSPVRPAESFSHHDQIKIDAQSSAQLQFLSGWVIVLHENSLATFELYRPGTLNSPALLSLIRGEYQVLTTGPTGALFIMQNKMVFSPDAQPPEKIRKADLISPKTTISSPISAEDLPAEAPTPIPDRPSLPNANNAKILPDKLPYGSEETLSSSYIEQVLGSRGGELRRCQINSLRDNTKAIGSLLVSLTISPNGQVEKTKVLQDQIKNEQLTRCAISVLERAQFKSFSGLPITLTYPLQFQ